MRDNNWELINGPAAHEIEVLNHENQINVIEATVRFYTSIAPVDSTGCHAHPPAHILLELHRAGTLFLLDNPGCYRKDYDVVVKKPDGTIIYEPPKWQDVEALMVDFHETLAGMWSDPNRVKAAAYSLWRINWIHPFRNGNGRSARGFAYACLCLKFGVFLPGSPTVIDMIMADRQPYQEALRHADETYASSGTPDLSLMENYLGTLLIKQLTGVSA